MKPAVTLSVFGAARARFEALREHAAPVDALEALARSVDVGAHDVDGEAAFLAAELVRWQPGLDDTARQGLMLLALASMVSVGQGSTRLPLDDRGYLRQLAASILPDGRGRALVDAAVALIEAGGAAAVVGGPDDYKPLVVADGCLYHHRMLAAERRLVDQLATRLAAPEIAVASEPLDAALATVRGDGPFKLSAEQLAAVRAAIVRRFAVISGGPGTGKTAIIVSILRALARLGVEVESIALAAPTGKAAQRMRGSIAASLHRLRAPELFDLELLRACPPPQTLHRLLGYSPRADRFRHHENNRLAQSVVIVDEGSMIDVFLMERLLRSVRDDARLILLGDADQLPSVDAGAVLRDLAGGAAVRLTRSYRMNPADPDGRAILTVANHINAGRAAKVDGTDGVVHRETPAALAWRGVELLDCEVSDFVDTWYEQRIRSHPAFERLTGQVYRLRAGDFDAAQRAGLDALFAHFEASRILTVTRGQPTGAGAINQRLHALALARATVERRPDFYPGEPVIMRENDYDRALFNGDQGLILRVAEDDGPQHFRAVFPRAAAAPGREARSAYRVFHLDALRHQIELAYAMTVHKSQGSEFDTVAVVLPHVDLPLLTRELLYTACTRARRSVAFVGEVGLLGRGIMRRTRRFTGVADALTR